MRQARSRACASVDGFQSGSNNKTRFAPVKFIPKPPTLVVNKKTNTGSCISSAATPSSPTLPASLKESTKPIRCATGVVPSIRRYVYPSLATACSKISSICCVCEKTRHRWPWLFHMLKIFSATCNLPERTGSP